MFIFKIPYRKVQTQMQSIVCVWFFFYLLRLILIRNDSLLLPKTKRIYSIDGIYLCLYEWTAMNFPIPNCLLCRSSAISSGSFTLLAKLQNFSPIQNLYAVQSLSPNVYRTRLITPNIMGFYFSLSRKWSSVHALILVTEIFAKLFHLSIVSLCLYFCRF